MVPTAIYKAIYDPARNEAGAYLVDNAPGAVPQVMSISELTKIAGLDVFPAASIQTKNRAMRLPLPKPRKSKGD